MPQVVAVPGPNGVDNIQFPDMLPAHEVNAAIQKHLAGQPTVPQPMPSMMPAHTPQAVNPPSTVVGGGMGTMQDFNQETPNTMAGILGQVGSLGNTLLEKSGLATRQGPNESNADFQIRQMAQSAMMLSPTYHGSPFEFEFPDISKIGTGEGNQAYGHGIYFAENPKVAGTYAVQRARPSELATYNGLPITELQDNFRNTVGYTDRKDLAPEDRSTLDKIYTLNNLATDGSYGTTRSNYTAQLTGELKDLARLQIRRQNAKTEGSAETLDRLIEEGQSNIESLKNGLSHLDAIEKEGTFQFAPTPKPPAMYNAEIRDDHIDKMLDWDKPLNQQHPDTQAFLMKAMRQERWDPKASDKANSSYIERMTGSEAHSALCDKFSNDWPDPQAAVAEYLKQNGIPGIKYLDHNSRSLAYDINQMQYLKNMGIPKDQAIKQSMGAPTVEEAEPEVVSRAAKAANHVYDGAPTVHRNIVVFDPKASITKFERIPFDKKK